MSEFTRIQVVEIEGKRQGKTLLITAGMDGDEYAGIEAAKRLAVLYQSRNFAGRLIIVPTVNADGYAARTSENPFDGKLPKNIYPGRASGSASERLVHWLKCVHIDRADAWHDMHGGASNEFLRPFLWMYKTGVREVDALTNKLIRASSTDTILCQKVGWFSKPRALARAGKFFVMAESGQHGEINERDIARHVQWVEETMMLLEMLEESFEPNQSKQVLTKIPLQEPLWWKDHRTSKIS